MNTNKKLVIGALSCAVALAVTLTVFILIRPHKESETTDLPPLEPIDEQDTLSSESEPEHYHFETNESDVIRDIHIIPIGD